MSGQQTVADGLAQHLPFLNRLVRGLTRGDSMAEDIVQQTMLKALIHADQFRSESSLRTWLVSIAINEVRQIYRCKWRTRSVPLTRETVESDLSVVVESPNVHYQASEREILIRQAISSLPESYRCVIELCDLQSMPLKEAAVRLRLTMSAIKTRRRRARRKLSPLVANLHL